MSKRTKIHLAKNLSFDTSIITEVVDLIAKRGSGKTYTATKLAEEMLIVGAQVVAIDPVGNWYGLRLGSNGKSNDGLDIKILGGRNGDIPLEHTAGKVVAKTIVDTGMSAVLDVSLLSKAKQRRFITDFAIELLECRKRDPSAMHLFWEEAYRFMPQKMSKGSQSEMLEATEELVTMGRNFGIGSTIIALRSALISKNVLTQAGVLVAMHTNAPSDRKVIDAWVEHQKIDKEDLSLASLKTGEAYVWWPEEFGIKRIKVSKKQTFDASSTPKFGEKSRKRKLKSVDLDALQVSMAETIEKVKSDDPRLLKRRIAELEKQLKAKPAKVEPEIVEVPVLSDDIARKLADSVGELRAVCETIESSMSEAKPKGTVQRHRAGTWRPMASPAQSPSRARNSTSTDSSADPGITAGALRMLKALAAVSPGGLTKKQVATAARMKSSSGTFGTYWSRLNVAGFLSYGENRWFITEAGMDHLGDDIPTQPDSPEEKVDFWCERLSGKAREILRFLFTYQDDWFTKADLGEAVGLVHTSGTFGTYLSSLTSNNLAERANGTYRISADLIG